MRRILLAATLAAICGPAGSSVAPAPDPSINYVSTPVVRTAQTVSGQALHLPQGKAEMVATTVEIPPNGKTTVHKHPWSRFVYVERGPLRVVNLDTGQVHDLQTGQVFAEVVDQWHQGTASGPNGARLLVIDLVPPGATNMTMR